jgi:tetratricopeptide (TPR) repeat protein
MKKYLLLIFAIGILNMLSASQAEYDSLRIKADELYREGKTDTAYWLYEGLIKEGLEDAHLFANMGNAALQQNKMAEAVSWYEKSLHLNPDNELVKNNLKYALNKLEQEYQEQDQFERILKSPVFSMALWWMSAALLALVLFVNRRFIRIVSGSMAAFTMLIATVLTFNLRIFHPESQAIVLSDAAVYSLPSELSDEVYEFSPGNKINIIKQENNWSQVQLGKRKKGWVRSAHIALVK